MKKTDKHGNMKYKVTVPMPVSRNGVRSGLPRHEWVKENIGKEHDTWEVMGGDADFLIYSFDQAENATLFSLRWSGVEL